MYGWWFMDNFLAQLTNWDNWNFRDRRVKVCLRIRLNGLRFGFVPEWFTFYCSKLCRFSCTTIWSFPMSLPKWISLNGCSCWGFGAGSPCTSTFPVGYWPKALVYCSGFRITARKMGCQSGTEWKTSNCQCLKTLQSLIITFCRLMLILINGFVI